MTRSLLVLALGLLVGCSSTPEGASTQADRPMYKSWEKGSPEDITINAYGAHKGAPKALKIGDSLPAFELPVAIGGTFDPVEHREEVKQDLVLVFYRGHW